MAALLSPAVPTQADVLDAWMDKQQGIRSWSADFVQTRTLKTLTEPLTAKGRLWFVAPNQFRWELGDPARTIAVRQSDQLYVIYPRLKRAERYPVGGKRTGEWGSALSLLEAGFPRSRSEIDTTFRVVSEERGPERITLTLEPKSTSARRLIPRIRIELAADDYTLRATELEFPDGSKLRNDFTNPQLNPEVPLDLFQVQLPNDYRITEPLAR